MQEAKKKWQEVLGGKRKIREHFGGELEGRFLFC